MTNAEVKAELNPLSKEDFENLYNKAWKNGWVYGKFFQELYDEYLVNWVYFVDYLDVLKGVAQNERMYERVNEKFVIVTAKKQNPIIIEAEDHFSITTETKNWPERIEILIGEAPPYWKGNAENKDKSYFYNPHYFEKKGSWITAPLAFKGIKSLESSAEDKIKKLYNLAKTGMFLFDIFPFPIIQDTKIRQAVSGKFPEHIKNYFIPKLKSIIEYIRLEKENVNIKYGFVATTFGSLHLLFGDKTRELFLKEFDPCFYKNGIQLKIQLPKRNFVFELSNPTVINQIQAFNNEKPTALFKYIYKLICPEAVFEYNFKNIKDVTSFNGNKYVKEINLILNENMIPILMDGSGNVNFTKFFNYKKLTKTFEENKPED